LIYAKRLKIKIFQQLKHYYLKLKEKNTAAAQACLNRA